VEMTCLWDVVEERSASGSFRPACVSAASLQARRWREYRRVGTKCPTTQAALLRQTLARRGDVLAFTRPCVD
jgi:hypothetical protein